MLSDPDATDVLECRVPGKLRLGVPALQVAEDDDRLRKAVAVRDRLQPRRFLDGVRRAAIAFDVHGLDDVRAVELLEQPLDAPVRTNHLVVPEALVVSGRSRIPKPLVGEPFELPQVMVRLDERDTPIDLCGDLILVRVAVRRLGQRGPPHDPPQDRSWSRFGIVAARTLAMRARDRSKGAESWPRSRSSDPRSCRSVRSRRCRLSPRWDAFSAEATTK